MRGGHGPEYACRLKPLMPTSAPSSVGSDASASVSVSAGRLKTSQCVKSPPGASGSSTTSARLLVPAGGALQVSCGDRSAPSQVKSTGIWPPDANDRLVTATDARVTPGGVEGCAPPDLHAP